MRISCIKLRSFRAAWLLFGGLSSAAIAQASPKGPLSVAVVVGLESESLNVPTIELYRAVSEYVNASSAWRVAARNTAKPSVSVGSPLASLGSLPAVERAEILKARALSSKKSRKASGSTIIPSIQGMLDTLALDGAIVVDCEPSGTAAVSGCGAYYYDRALGRILAASEKEFKVPIKDASLWASTLVQSLDQGLQGYVNRRERERLDRVLAETSADAPPDELALEMRAIGLGLSEPKRRVTGAPGLGLRFGKQSKSWTSGIEAAYGFASSESGGVITELDDRLVGLFFTLESRALETMRWELDFGIGYAQTAVVADDGTLDTRSVRLRAGPGAMWELGRSLQCGIGLTYDRLVPIASSVSGVYEGKQLEKNMLGFGVRLKTVF